MAKTERTVYGGVTIREHVDHSHPDLGVREMMFIGFPISMERTPMWLRLHLPIEHVDLVATSTALRHFIINGRMLTFWNNSDLRVKFWNFWRQWTGPVRYALGPSQFQTIQGNLLDIVTTLRKAPYHFRDSDEETPVDFLNYLQIELEEPMNSLSSAIAINDVDTIVRRAPWLQAHWENIRQRLNPVKKWAQRKYVAEALGLSSFDPVMINAAEEANEFLRRLNQVLASYTRWKDKVAGFRGLRRAVKFA